MVSATLIVIQTYNGDMTAVIDANIFMRGKASLDFDDLLTSPSVIEELESSSSRLKLSVTDVDVVEPSAESIEKVGEKSEEINSPTSKADEELLALALDRGAVLVTDDMALQNLASIIDVEFESYIGEKIDSEFRWRVVCDNCGNERLGEKCGRCGSTRKQRKRDQYSSG